MAACGWRMIGPIRAHVVQAVLVTLIILTLACFLLSSLAPLSLPSPVTTLTLLTGRYTSSAEQRPAAVAVSTVSATPPATVAGTTTTPSNDGHNDVETDSVKVGGEVKVLISGYYRSGSTLTGDLFAASPATMYLYEVSATDAVQWHVARLQLSQGHNSTNVLPSTVPALCHAAIVRPLYDIFQCNIGALSHQTLTNNFWQSKSSAGAPMKRFLNCSRHLPRCRHGYRKQCTASHTHDVHKLHACYRALYGNDSRVELGQSQGQTVWRKIEPLLVKYKRCAAGRAPRVAVCAQLLAQDCHTAAVRCVKEIRFDMRLVPALLDLDPHIKVIHLVRDPRGMMAATRASRKVRDRCDQMLTDIRAFQQTVRLYPGCCMQLRYEDLATQPTLAASRVYKHVGVASHKYLADWWTKIHNPAGNRGFLGTYRSNMTAEAFDWTRKLSKSAVNSIVRHDMCLQVIRLLGYEL